MKSNETFFLRQEFNFITFCFQSTSRIVSQLTRTGHYYSNTQHKLSGNKSVALNTCLNPRCQFSTLIQQKGLLGQSLSRGSTIRNLTTTTDGTIRLDLCSYLTFLSVDFTSQKRKYIFSVWFLVFQEGILRANLSFSKNVKFYFPFE